MQKENNLKYEILKDSESISKLKDETYMMKSKIDNNDINIYNINGSYNYKKGVELSPIIDSNNTIRTGSKIGFLNYKDNKLVIKSRFDSNSEYYFLSYLLESVFNLGDLKEENIIIKKENEISLYGNFEQSLSILLFMNLLEEASSKGIYREYNEGEFNDARVKGRIDLTRHIRENQIVAGRTAYTIRELSIKNPVNTLILKTYKILLKSNGKLVNTIINTNKSAQQYINKLNMEIAHADELSSQDIISKTSKKIVNPLFREYEKLRQISREILKSKGNRIYDDRSKKVCGIIIDFEELWQKYIYKDIIKKLNTKEELKDSEKEIKVIGASDINKPDFMVKIKNKKIILNSRYSPIWEKTYSLDKADSVEIDILEKDLKNITSFMKFSEGKAGGVIFPVNNLNEFEMEELNLKLEDEKYYKIPYKIPSNVRSYEEFKEKISEVSLQVINNILKLI